LYAGRGRRHRAESGTAPRPPARCAPPDFLFDGIGHRHRAAQRDLFLRKPADDRILHVPVVVRELGVDEARQLHAPLLHFGRELRSVEHLGRERTFHVHEVELAVLEGEEARLVFLHDADLDPADLRHLLALHLGHERTSPGSLPALKSQTKPR
jgi:hypothetical protein